MNITHQDRPIPHLYTEVKTSKTIDQKADFAAKQVVRALTGLADNKTCIQAARESYGDWYEMFYELLTDTIDYEEYKEV